MVSETSHPHSQGEITRRRRRLRTIFVSLPDDSALTRFLEEHFSAALEKRYEYLQAVSYRKLRQGKWLPQIEDAIATSNAVVAFIKDLNPNVLLEVGQAVALGKPVIPIAPPGLTLPSMLSHLQVLRYSGKGPSQKLLHDLLDAIDIAVFTVLHRERSDLRTAIQKRLLLGTDVKPKKAHYGVRARKTLSGADAQLSNARRAYTNARFDEAADLLYGCLDLGLTKEEVFHLLADTWFLSGEAAVEEDDARECYSEMLSVADRGLSLFSGSFLLRKDRSLALLKLGRYSEAELQLNHLLRDGDHGIVYYNLACLNALIGNRTEALLKLQGAIRREEYYRELARIDPDFDSIWDDRLFQTLVFQVARS